MAARRWLIRVVAAFGLLLVILDGGRHPLVTIICIPLIVGAMLIELRILPLEGSKK